MNIKQQTIALIKSHVEEHTPCESVEMDYSRYAFIIPEGCLEQVKRLTVGAVTRVESSFAIPIAAAVGPAVIHTEQLKESYQISRRLLDRQFALYKQSVLTYEDLSRMKSTRYDYSLEVERELIISVVQGNEKKAIELLDRILEDNSEGHKFNEETWIYFLYSFVSTINRIMQQMNKDERDIFLEGKSVYDLIRSARSVEQLRSILHHMIEQLIEAAVQTHEERDNSVVNRMIQYVHDNYDKDIALSDLAEYFNLSSNYISFLIKEHIGDNFKDYLNEYRVRQAKRIMREQPTVKINDLAGLVGCNNANTFIRIFKKYEGVSPGQYLKQKY